VQLTEQRMLETRQAGRSKRLKAMDKVRPTIPPEAFAMPLQELELANDIMEALKNVPNVGELMVRLLADEDNLRHSLQIAKAGEDAMDAINEAIDWLVLAPAMKRAEEEAKSPKPKEVEIEQPEAQVAVAEPVAEAEVAAVAEDEEAPPAFIDDEPVFEKPKATKAQARRAVAPPVEEPEPVIEVEVGEVAEVEDPEAWKAGDKKGKTKKGKNRGRELIFDERRGEVVSKRKRKGSRSRGWDYEEE
jgi:hypothetical protein